MGKVVYEVWRCEWVVVTLKYGGGDFIFFFFNDTATTEIYTLSLHDALPIYNKSVLIDENGK